MPFRRRREPVPASNIPGWAVGDPSVNIWGVSHNHLANALEEFWKGPGQGSYEFLIQEGTAAMVGFMWLAEIGERLDLTQPVADATEDFVKGLTLEDHGRTMRGYGILETVIGRLREQFGDDVRRSWNLEEIDIEFDRLIEASDVLVERLCREDLTVTDIENTYELAVKIAHGWTRLAEGGYFPSYSDDYVEATTRITSGLKDDDQASVQAGVARIAALHRRLTEGETIIITGEQPREGDPVDYAGGLPGRQYVAAANGRPVEGHADRWAVEVLISDPET